MYLQLALAEVCAVEPWNGFNYQTGKEFDIFDEDLLVMFSMPTFAVYKSARTRQQLGFVDSRAFVSRFKTEASVIALLSKPHKHLPMLASLVDYSFVEYGFFVVVK